MSAQLPGFNIRAYPAADLPHSLVHAATEAMTAVKRLPSLATQTVCDGHPTSSSAAGLIKLWQALLKRCYRVREDLGLPVHPASRGGNKDQWRGED